MNTIEKHRVAAMLKQAAIDFNPVDKPVAPVQMGGGGDGVFGNTSGLGSPTGLNSSITAGSLGTGTNNPVTLSPSTPTPPQAQTPPPPAQQAPFMPGRLDSPNPAQPSPEATPEFPAAPVPAARPEWRDPGSWQQQMREQGYNPAFGRGTTVPMGKPTAAPVTSSGVLPSPGMQAQAPKAPVGMTQRQQAFMPQLRQVQGLIEKLKGTNDLETWNGLYGLGQRQMQQLKANHTAAFDTPEMRSLKIHNPAQYKAIMDQVQMPQLPAFDFDAGVPDGARNQLAQRGMAYPRAIPVG
jgi:hypothetical protein